MGIQSVGSTVDIAISGLRAQQTRMNVVAGNIANVNTSRTAAGEPFRRQEVVLSSDASALGGVETLEIVPDVETEFRRMFQPGHPDADDSGFLTLPNVELPVEMMNMVSASRAYQANAAVLKRFQDNVNLTLELLR